MKTKMANFISNLSNPGLLAVLILLAAVFKSKMPSTDTVVWVLAILILNTLIPGLIYLFFTTRGYVFDDSLQNKKVQRERLILFLVFLILVVLELLVLIGTKNYYQPLLAVMVGGIITIALGSLVTFFWKISVHAVMITFFVAMVILMVGWSYWPVALLIPLVMWSRLVLYRHNIWQLILGMIFSLIIVIATFGFYGILNL